MAEDSRGGAACTRVGEPQDLAHGAGRCNFPEYELLELSTCVFHVGSFGELWRGRLRGAGDLSLKEPTAPEQPGSLAVTDSHRDDAEVARDLGCSLEAAAELRTVCGSVQGPGDGQRSQKRCSSSLRSSASRPGGGL